jgi:phosphate transport system substrate-binding protein
MRKIMLWIFISLVSVFLVSGCGNKRTSITAAGSTAFQPFAEKLADQYMMSHTNINIIVQGGGSAVGIQSALSGAAQIGMADLVQLPQEAKALQATVVAKDGIVIVVHPTNTITNLSTDQIRDIFSGKIKTWQELGGAAASITVVSREAGSGTRISFEQIIQNLTLTRDAIIQDSNGTIRETVANDPNAVGYLSHGLLNERIKAQTVDNVACSNEAIQNGDYKLSRPIFLLTKETRSADVAGFIDYILSPEGQQTISSSGLIPAK